MSRCGQEIPTGSVMLHKGLSSGASQDPLSLSDLKPTSKHPWVSPHLRSALLTCVQGAFQYGDRGQQKAYHRDWRSTWDPVPPLTVSLCLLTSYTLFCRQDVPTFLPHSRNTFLSSSHAPCSPSSDQKKPHLPRDPSSR